MIVHRQTSLRVPGGSPSEVSAMDDRRKCRTYAASPAEPGGLPVMLARRHDRISGTTDDCETGLPSTGRLWL